MRDELTDGFIWFEPERYVFVGVGTVRWLTKSNIEFLDRL